jgi:hypothetical protein
MEKKSKWHKDRDLNPNLSEIILNINVPVKNQRFSKCTKILKTQLYTACKLQPLNIQIYKY